jgi:hypothetical protein
VKAAHDRVDGPVTGQAPGVPADVDDPGVSAACDDEQAFVLDVHDEGLVVEDERVRFPAAAEHPDQA